MAVLSRTGGEGQGGGEGAGGGSGARKGQSALEAVLHHTHPGPCMQFAAAAGILARHVADGHRALCCCTPT